MIRYYFVYFIIMSIIGYLYETAAMVIWSGHWDRRGFLFGPVIPIYGIGSLLSLSLFSHMYPEHSLLMVFLAGFIGSAILEYPTSWFLEKVFHTRWWDYSVGPWNLNGRISLLSSLGFGLGAVIIVYVLNPLIADPIMDVSARTMLWWATVLAFIFMADLMLTLYCLKKKDEPDIVRNMDDRMAGFISRLNPNGNSLYSYLKRKTGLFR